MDIEAMRSFLDLEMTVPHLGARDNAGRGIVYIWAKNLDTKLFKDTKKYIHFSWWLGLLISQDSIDNDREVRFGIVLIGIHRPFLPPSR